MLCVSCDAIEMMSCDAMCVSCDAMCLCCRCYVSLLEVLSLFKLMAAGYHCLQQYQLTQAVTMFRSLPRRHYNTAWVLTCTAQAFIAGERFREVSRHLVYWSDL